MEVVGEQATAEDQSSDMGLGSNSDIQISGRLEEMFNDNIETESQRDD